MQRCCDDASDAGDGAAGEAGEVLGSRRPRRSRGGSRAGVGLEPGVQTSTPGTSQPVRPRAQGPPKGCERGTEVLIPGVGAAARAPALQTDFTHVSREAFITCPLSLVVGGPRASSSVPTLRGWDGLVYCHPRAVLGAAFWAGGDCALLTPVMVLGAAGALRASSGEDVSSRGSCCVPLAVYIFSSMDLSQSRVSRPDPPSG